MGTRPPRTQGTDDTQRVVSPKATSTSPDTWALSQGVGPVVWDYAGRRQRLLVTTITSSGARAIRRRFRLALSWIAIGTLLGALLPILGVCVIAAFIPFYWRPIPGEVSAAP